jgi:WXG100 family type VII secretion target
VEFTADAAALARAQALIADVAADLAKERAALDRSVSGLLGSGWSGPAAEEYREAWGEWRDGADRVLAALHTESELLGSTRAAYLAGDDASVQTTAPISARLQDRLS